MATATGNNGISYNSLVGEMNMKGIMRGLLIAVGALVVSASVARAQKTMTLGISAGLSLPSGDFADLQASGYHVGGHLNFAPESLPVELLLDGTFHSFKGNLDQPLPIDFR